MTPRTLIAAGFAASLILALPQPVAHAEADVIRPGDRIDYVTEDGSASFCTTGYVYTGVNGRRRTVRSHRKIHHHRRRATTVRRT